MRPDWLSLIGIAGALVLGALLTAASEQAPAAVILFALLVVAAVAMAARAEAAIAGPLVAGLGAAFYGACNAAIRFPGDALRARFGDVPLMIGSLLVAIAGFTGLGFTTSFAAGVTAFAMVGLGTAVLIPCTFAMAAAFVPENRPGALSFVSLLTIVPRTLSPWFFGVAAAGLGIGAAFGLVAVALAVALGLLVILSRVGPSR